MIVTESFRAMEGKRQRHAVFTAYGVHGCKMVVHGEIIKGRSISRIKLKSERTALGSSSHIQPFVAQLNI